MTFLDFFKRVRRGIKAGVKVMQSTKEENETFTQERILYLISTFNNSKRRNWMAIGQQYYDVENDILHRKMTRKVDGVEVEESYKANNKIAHAKYKNMVDEKIGYVLSKPYSLKCDNKDYIEKVKKALGKSFGYTLAGLGYEASNKGIAWLQVYVDEIGKFKVMIIPSEQCIPVWKDNSHMELECMIRKYDKEIWLGSTLKTISIVEVWTEIGVTFYKYESGMLIPDINKNEDENGPIAHYKRNNEWTGWGRVPFIAFKNNRREYPDIKYVKTLCDQYDKSRSEAGNFIEEVKNLVYVLKGYGGENLDDFMRTLNENRAILIDDPEDGGVDTLTPEMNIDVLKEHYEQLKRDLIEDGQSVNKDLDKFGTSPSGIALSFMYSGLDLKANALENEFKMGFENIIYFINQYIGASENYDIEIILNRDMKMNESEVILSCGNSKGIISDDTIIANHPWVKDVEQEKKKLESQKKESIPYQDKVPLEKE